MRNYFFFNFEKKAVQKVSLQIHKKNYFGFLIVVKLNVLKFDFVIK